MQHTLYSGGLRALLAAAASTGALWGAPALAQASGEDAVAQCRDLPTDAARISCLEEALIGSRPTAQPAPATAAAAAAASAAAVAAPEPEPESVERRGGLRLPGIPFVGGGDREASIQRPVVPSDTPEAESFGDEMVAVRQRAAGDGPPEVIPHLTAAVASAKEVYHRRLEVTLDNGQVWRQIQSDQSWDSRRYDDPDQVEIWASRTGGYRLHIPETNVTLTVERVE